MFVEKNSEHLCPMGVRMAKFITFAVFIIFTLLQLN